LAAQRQLRLSSLRQLGHVDERVPCLRVVLEVEEAPAELVPGIRRPPSTGERGGELVTAHGLREGTGVESVVTERDGGVEGERMFGKFVHHPRERFSRLVEFAAPPMEIAEREEREGKAIVRRKRDRLAISGVRRL